jgi:uncharacterized membrane protein
VKHLRAFARFWWDFVVGDDWRVALGIALAIALTWLLANRGANVWWLLPVAVVLVLAGSLLRVARAGAS